MKLPLEGIKVLDLTTLLPGPLCSMMLGDYGAEVIKVEPPTGDAARWTSPKIGDLAGLFLLLNRNKKSLTLSLKEQEGKEVFYKLVKEADVIIEQYRPGVVKKLGVDYETIKKINPKVVYCSISGYGQDGPYAQLAGHDINYISYAGVLGLRGRDTDKPAIPGFQIADVGGGTLMALNGILMALLARAQNGEGQYIDISMMDGVISCLPLYAGGLFASGMVPGSEKSKVSGHLACYQLYATRDGKYISLGAIEPHFWARVCQYFNKEEYIKMQTDVGKQDEIISFLQDQFLLKDRDEWIQIFNEIDVCMAPVYGLNEVFQDPQVLHRKMIFEMEHPRFGTIKQLGFPIKMSETPARVLLPPPDLGQNNEEILSGLGYSSQDIEALREKGCI